MNHFSCVGIAFSDDHNWWRTRCCFDHGTCRQHHHSVFFNYTDGLPVFPSLFLVLVAGAAVCYNSLFYQNGNNPKTRAAFLATLLVMLLLILPIYIITWRAGSYGLNELQISEDDFMYYYDTDLSVSTCFM